MSELAARIVYEAFQAVQREYFAEALSVETWDEVPEDSRMFWVELGAEIYVKIRSQISE